MGYARFSFLQINVRPLAETPQNAVAKQTLRVSSLRVVGHCCQGAVSFHWAWTRQTVQACAKLRWKNSLVYCCAATALCSADCLNERVSRSRGTSWGAFIGGGKHAEKFA